MVFCESGRIGFEECGEGDVVAFGDAVRRFAFLSGVELGGRSGALVFFEGSFDRGEALDGQAEWKIRRDGMIGISEQFSQHGVVEVECFFGELCELEQILKPEGFGQQELAEADGFLGGAVGGALIVVDEQSGSEELGVKVSSIKAEATVAGALDDDIELFGLEASGFVEDASGALVVGGDRKRP